MAAGARAIIVQLCSLKGEVFPSPQHRQEHFARCLAALSAFLSPPAAVAGAAASGSGDAEAALLDGTRALLLLSAVHPPADWAAPLPPVAAAAAGSGDQQQQQQAAASGLHLLVSVALACVQAGRDAVEPGSGPLSDALGMCLETLEGLLRAHRGAPGVALSALAPAPLLEAAEVVFNSVAAAAMAAAAASAHEDDDGDDETGGAGAEARDDRLARLAALARSAPFGTFPALAAATAARRAQLSEAVSRGADTAPVLEELTWLARMSAHMLADSGDGETPLQPTELVAAAAAAAARGAADPCQALSTELLQTGVLCLDLAARPAISARLMEALCWALARWADTYLMPEDVGGSLYAAARRAEGSGSNGGLPTFSAFTDEGKRALEALLRVASAALSGWPGEAALAREAAGTLLPVLTRRKALCKALVASRHWEELVSAAAVRAAPLDTLPPDTLRLLSLAVMRAAWGVDPPACPAFVSAACAHAAAEVRSVAAQAGPGSAASAAASAVGPREQSLICSVESLRGVSRGTLPRTSAPLFAIFSALFDDILTLLRAYSGLPQVVIPLLKLVSDIVEAQVTFTGATQAATLVGFAAAAVHARVEAGARAAAAAKVEGAAGGLRAERTKEAYREVKALLSILTHITSRELVDAAEAESPSAAAASTSGGMRMGVPHSKPLDEEGMSEVVFRGLASVLPLLTQELLLFPKLCRKYFSLLGHMLEVYPSRVAALATADFASLVDSLRFGLAHSDPLISGASLEALAALARFQLQERAAGRAGLGANAVVPGPAGAAGPVSVLAALEARLRLRRPHAIT